MISDKLFIYLRNNWKDSIITVIIFIIASIAEIYEKGMYIGSLVISGILIVITLSVVICDLVIWIFRRYKLGYEWLVLFMVTFLYAITLIVMGEIKVLKTVILFSFSFSITFFILFKVREFFSDGK